MVGWQDFIDHQFFSKFQHIYILQSCKLDTRLFLFERTYTLNIAPMKKVLNEDGAAPTTGIKQAFHLCRGYFRTYDENSKGMFGRYKGTFWVPAHTRGDEQLGKIGKLYSLGVAA